MDASEKLFVHCCVSVCGKKNYYWTRCLARNCFSVLGKILENCEQSY